MAISTNGATAPQKPTPQPPPPSRMQLSALVKGKQKRPQRVVLYGVEGIGKSTFAAGAPKVVFLGAEKGTDHLDVVRFPEPQTYEEAKDAIRVLLNDPHEFQTVALDTLDWLEPLLWAFICKRDGQPNIEAYGYGKGYQAALDEWRAFLAALEQLREKRGMGIILLAHAHIRPFKNPEGNDFDRYQLKLNDKAAGLIKEWSDHVLFANFETFAEENKKTKRVKGVSTGARLVYTTRTAAYDAKNRASLPECMPLDWLEFEAAVGAHQPADPKALREEIERKAAGLADKHRELVTKKLGEAGEDAEKLDKINVWINGKLTQTA